MSEQITEQGAPASAMKEQKGKRRGAAEKEDEAIPKTVRTSLILVFAHLAALPFGAFRSDGPGSPAPKICPAKPQGRLPCGLTQEPQTEVRLSHQTVQT